MSSKLILYKIEILLSKSPSILRIGTAIWPLRIISYILSPIFFIGGIVSVLASATFMLLIENAKEELDKIHISNNDIGKTANDIAIALLKKYINELESYASIFFIGGAVMIIASILFLIIAWLCRLVRNRNTFIGETTSTLTSIKNDLAQTDKNA